jgi:asparaginyl-tRNA synthetase
VGDVNLSLTPNPRSDFDFYNPKYVNHILNNRHFYIRNPKVIATIKLKNSLLKSFRFFFENKNFTEVDMPILSQGYLYSRESSFKTDYFGTEAYLSQCCGMYLGATVNSLERIFTVAPSFRTEPSKSPRHNPEFWHIKAQVAFFDLDDMISFTSEMVYEVVKQFKILGAKELDLLKIDIDSNSLKPPYPVITYDDAVQIIKKSSKNFVWGKSLNQREEKLISSKFTTPIFIKGMPKQVEPFPYKMADMVSCLVLLNSLQTTFN